MKLIDVAPSPTLPRVGRDTSQGEREISQGRLRGRIVPVTTLDEKTRRNAFDLFRTAYESADWHRFQKDLADKQRIIVMRDAQTRELKGFSTVHIGEVETDRGKGTVVFSGDTVIAKACWGQKELQKQFSLLVLRLQLANPLRPLFWFLISKGYKTYLMMMSTCPHSIPRHDRQDDPRLRRLLDALASARFGNRYDAAHGLVRSNGHERVRAGLAPVDGSLLENPHVRFFVERNPDHALGDELACLAQVRIQDSASTALRVARARLRRRLGGR